MLVYYLNAGRLLRHVCAMGHLQETGPDEYNIEAHDLFAVAEPRGDWRRLCCPVSAQLRRCANFPLLNHVLIANRLGGIGRSPVEFHKFLRNTNWQNPTDAARTAMHQCVLQHQTAELFRISPVHGPGAPRRTIIVSGGESLMPSQTDVWLLNSYRFY
jgi:hypothetical protein